MRGLDPLFQVLRTISRRWPGLPTGGWLAFP